MYHLLLGTIRKSHRQNSGSFKKNSKLSRDSVPPYLQSALPLLHPTERLESTGLVCVRYI